jgi:XTP/dITP diphosphohydrolase
MAVEEFVVRGVLGAPPKLFGMKKCLIASGNAHKVSEIRQILSGLPLEVLSLKDIENSVPEPAEDGLTFEANAQIKAEAYQSIFPDWILADDSGIVVPELEGEPGIYSARYAGLNANDAENRVKLQSKVTQAGKSLSAHFTCVLCLVRPNVEPLFFGAEWHGHIVAEDHGQNGFGYDPMFFPEGHDISAAEMSEVEKNVLSHRYQALQKFKDFVAQECS